KHDITKKVLKETMEEIFPKMLISKKKRGFTVPIEEWLKGPLKKDLLKNILDNPMYGEDFFDKEAINKYIQDFLDGKIHSGWGIWHIYSWQKWALKNNLS